MNQTPINNHKGFSLVEMLVYIGILVFMLVIILQVVLSVGSSDKIIVSLRNIETSASLALERVSREARTADTIVVASSVFGSHPGRLVLNSVNASGTSRTVEFYLSNGQLILRENGIDSGALTAGDAYVTNLVFKRFASSTVEGVSTELNITSGTSTSFRSETFYTSTLLR
jgi:type II secretory pathway pseudopilin PulG